MTTLHTRDATLGFTHGTIRVEVTGSGMSDMRFRDARLDAITRAVTNVALNGLVPAICTYNNKCVLEHKVRSGLDGFSHNIGASWLSFSVDVTVFVELSIDLPDDDMKRLVAKVMADIAQNAIRDALSAEFAELEYLGSIADMMQRGEGMFDEMPAFVSELLARPATK